MFRKKSVFINFAKYPRKQLIRSLFFNKVATQKVHAYFNKSAVESIICYRTPVVATSELKALEWRIAAVFFIFDYAIFFSHMKTAMANVAISLSAKR